MQSVYGGDGGTTGAGVNMKKSLPAREKVLLWTVPRGSNIRDSEMKEYEDMVDSARSPVGVPSEHVSLWPHVNRKAIGDDFSHAAGYTLSLDRRSPILPEWIDDNHFSRSFLLKLGSTRDDCEIDMDHIRSKYDDVVREVYGGGGGGGGTTGKGKKNIASLNMASFDSVDSVNARLDAAHDRSVWYPTLGNKASNHIGVYSHQKERGTHDYYIIGNIGAQKVASDVRDWWKHCTRSHLENSRRGTVEPLNAEALYHSDVYKKANALADANAQRMLAKVCDAMDVDVDTYEYPYARENNLQNREVPSIVVPHSMYATHSLEKSNDLRYRLHNGATSVADSADAIIVHKDPTAGVTIYKSKCGGTAKPRPSSRVGIDNVVPAHLGKNEGYASFNNTNEFLLPHSIKSNIEKNFHWPGKSDGVRHSERLTPGYYRTMEMCGDCIRSLIPNAHEHQEIHLTPEAVFMAHP